MRHDQRVTILAGKADVMMTSYLPLLAHPAFYLGIILMAVGTLVAVFNFFATLYMAKKNKTYEGRSRWSPSAPPPRRSSRW
jgi:heme/copper-type cytochrome/quinol oxidase subunit 1